MIFKLYTLTNEITSITLIEVDFLSRKIASLLFSELETLEIFYYHDLNY